MCEPDIPQGKKIVSNAEFDAWRRSALLPANGEEKDLGSITLDSGKTTLEAKVVCVTGEIAGSGERRLYDSAVVLKDPTNSRTVIIEMHTRRVFDELVVIAPTGDDTSLAEILGVMNMHYWDRDNQFYTIFSFRRLSPGGNPDDPDFAEYVPKLLADVMCEAYTRLEAESAMARLNP